jgi:sugar phosphate permease
MISLQTVMIEPIKRHRKIYHGWYVSFATCCSELGNHCASITLFSLFVMPMVSDFGWSRTQISLPASLGCVSGAMLSPIVGRLVDKYGARFILPAGAVVLAVSCLYMSMITSLIGFYVVFTLIRTIDQGVVNSATYPTIGKWFFKYKGKVTSLIMLTGALATVVSIPLMSLVITNYGWRVAWTVLSLFPIIFGILPALLFIRKNPEQMGLIIDGQNQIDDAHVYDVQQYNEWTLKDVLKTRFFWCVFTALFMIGAAGPGITLHLSSHLLEQGVSMATISTALVIFALSGALGIGIAGILADKFDIKMLMIIACIVATLSMGILIQADTMLETFVFVAIWGFSLITIHPLIPVLWSHIYGRALLGTINGMSRVTLVLGLASGPVISGLMYDFTNSYNGAFIFFMLGSLASVLLLIASGNPNDSKK